MLILFLGVRVVCLWDNPKLHTDLGPALRSLWRPAPTQTQLLNALLTDHPTTSPHKYNLTLSIYPSIIMKTNQHALNF